MLLINQLGLKLVGSKNNKLLDKEDPKLESFNLRPFFHTLHPSSLRNARARDLKPISQTTQNVHVDMCRIST